MNGLDPVCLCDVDDGVGIEIGTHRGRAFFHWDLERLIAFIAMGCEAVLLRVDANRAYVHLRACAHDAYGDFATIRGHDLGKRRIGGTGGG
jgi:hypothetical protein